MSDHRIPTLKALLLLIVVSILVGTAHAAILTLNVNQTTFRPGDTLHVGLQEENPGPGFYGDLYFGILLPDGVTVFFFTSLSPLNGVLTRLDATPQSFPSLNPSMFISQGLDVTLNDVFAFTFSGSEPLGTYVLFALLTPPNAFTDGRVDAGDILVIDTKSISTVVTSGQWLGTTSQGKVFNFVVDTPGTTITKINTGWSGCGDSTTEITGSISISQSGTFTLSGGGVCPQYTISGSFNAAHAASGTLRLTWTPIPYACPCSGSLNLTWTASGP